MTIPPPTSTSLRRKAPKVKENISSVKEIKLSSMLGDTSKTQNDGSTKEKPAIKRQKLQSTSTASTAKLTRISPGTQVVGRVKLPSEDKFKLQPGTVIVSFRHGSSARLGKIDITQCQDVEGWSDKPFEAYKDGQFLRCVVLRPIPNSPKSKFVELSTRPSLLAAAGHGHMAAFDEELEQSRKLPNEGDLVTGFVVATTSKGCFVKTSRVHTGRVMLKNLSQGFVQDVASEFPLGKLVAGRVLSADDITNKIELSLRASVVVGESEKRWALQNLVAGLAIDGVVHRVISSGVLISLPAAGNLIGLCHYSEAFDEMQPNRGPKKKNSTKHDEDKEGLKESLIANLRKTFNQGDAVKCMVLEVDKETQKVKLGLKPSYFASLFSNTHARDDAAEEILSDQNEELSEEGVSKTDSEDENKISNVEEHQGDDEDDGEAEEVPEDPQFPDQVTLQDALKVAGVKTSTVVASEQLFTRSDPSPSTVALNAQDRTSGKLNNRRKDALKRQQEAVIADAEDRVARDAEPETADEFERALVHRGNLSIVWIKYMSLMVSIGELDKARQVAERALKSIPHDDDTERNNLWTAYLSMELQFGSVDIAKSLFARMVRATDEKWAYLTLCDAYMALPESFTDRDKLAEEAIRGAKKASKQRSAKVWLRHCRLRFELGDVAGARTLLKESLRHLPSHKHVKLMTGFARLEFSHDLGDHERARTIMEGILENYAKRTDIWHVFIDLEVKYGSQEAVRRLFERALSVRMSTKKTKSLFKKWIQYESSDLGGGDDFVESIKERARAYLENLVDE